MNPGLPGTGIGGLFYIVNALWMPICEIWRRSRGHTSGRWHVVAMQFAIALGVLAAISGSLWALDSAIIHYQLTQQVAANTLAARSMRIAALLTTTGVLMALFSAVHLARLFFWLRGLRPAS